MHPHHTIEEHNRPLWREDYPGIPIPGVDGATEHAFDRVGAPEGKSLTMLHAKDPFGQIGFIARGFGGGKSEKTGAFHAGGERDGSRGNRPRQARLAP